MSRIARIASAAMMIAAAAACTRNTETNPFSDAKWIGTSQTVLYADFLPQFSISADLGFDPAAATHPSASLLFGANDPRLMDRNLNILGVENAKNESYMRVELDIDSKLINVYRTGYTRADKPGVVFASLPLPDSLLSENSKTGHDTGIKTGQDTSTKTGNNTGTSSKTSFHLSVDVALSELNISLDSTLVGHVNVGPLGHGGDYIAYPQLCDIGYLVEPKHSSATTERRNSNSPVQISNITVRNLREPYGILYWDSATYSLSEGWQICNPDHGGMPFLRSSFALEDKPVESASIVATARGIYQLFLNGKRVGDEELAPGLSQYNRTHYYQSYDVTDLLQSGENSILASLGEGWWSGGLTYGANCHNYFGDQLALLARLSIRYTDGQTAEFVTDPKTWEATTDGPVVFASMFQGQVNDARRTLENARWTAAEEMSLEGHLPKATFGETAPRVDDYSEFQLVSQSEGGVKVHGILTAQSVEQVRPGVFVYDMGQNFAGVPSISFSSLSEGQQVRLRFAEVKYPSLPAYKGNEGMIMLENIRSAMAQDIYIASGEESECFQPAMTLHGYRFVEITGIDRALPLSSVKGIVLSSVGEFTAHYECSNPLVNRLWENIKWSMLSNMVSIPTDCPQRNERMGWSGDISVFSRTATYLGNVDGFLTRHTRAMRDVQTPEGRMPDVAPIGGAFGGFLWGSAGITVPYECYRQYADIAVLEENYDAMKRYMEYVESHYIDGENGLFVQTNSKNFFGDLGDWLGPQNRQNDNSALWEAYYIFDLGIMEEVAGALAASAEKSKASSYEADASMFAAKKAARTDWYISQYIDRESGKALASEWLIARRSGKASDGSDNAPDWAESSLGKKAGSAPADGNQGSGGAKQYADIQSSYVLPLAFGFIEDPALRAKVAANLVAAIQREGYSDSGALCPPYSLMTGFITTAWISKALSDNGYSNIAYKLLQQTSYPSWLYPVTQGATTIWERLDSYTHKDGFGGNNSMNSFNHYSFGAVGQWLIAYSLGIDRDPSSPGFKHFTLHPEADMSGGMSYARGWYDCEYGRIESSWEMDKASKTVKYEFTIPEGCSATLILPGRDAVELKAGSYRF